MKKLLLLSLFLLPFISSAQSLPKFPMAFYGEVTIDNIVAPAGTVVKAYYGNTFAGESTVDSSGAYGYASSTANKLLVGEGSGIITFTFQSASILFGQESLGNITLSHSGFEEGISVLKNLNFTTHSATQTTPDNNGLATISSLAPQVLITNPNQAVTINLDNGVSSPSIDVSSFITNGEGTLPAISVNSSNASVSIPAATVVTSASQSWDGVISAPIITTVTLPTTFGQTKVLSTAIELGYTGAKLSFDNGIRILLTGQAGKKAGYIRTGISFTEITAVCSADNQTVGDALPADGDCKIDVGGDLIIWTKHFTKFATYSQTTNSSSSGGGGGGGSSTVVLKSIASSTATSTVQAINTVSAVSVNPGYFFTSNMKLGVSGNDVNKLQEKLKAEGLYSGPISGYFGNLTLEAVKAFQKKMGLPETGFVGSMTREKLNDSPVVVNTGSSISIKDFVNLLVALGIITPEKVLQLKTVFPAL